MCITLTSGTKEFIQQVQNNSKIPANEKNILIKERNQIKDCASQTYRPIQVNQQWNQITRQYASYLNGIILFYNTNFFIATKIYTALSTVNDPWIKEPSQYMLIRTALNETYATAADTYGDIDQNKIDQNLLKNFFNQITTYFTLYPKGKKSQVRAILTTRILDEQSNRCISQRNCLANQSSKLRLLQFNHANVCC